MRTHVGALVGGYNLPKCLLFLILITLIVVPVLGAPQPVNTTYHITNDASTPFAVWVGAIALGLLLVLISFFPFPNGEEGLVSIMAWFPTGFALYTAFAVDMGVSTVSSATGLTEIHQVNAYPVVAIGLAILLFFEIGNTYRIWATQKKLAGLSVGESKEDLLNDS